MRPVKADAATVAAPVNKASAEKELTAVKAEVAKADATHKAAIKATTAAKNLVNTTTANLTKAQADHKAKATDATTKRNASNASKAALDKLVAGKQKPAQAAQAATAATTTELIAAKAFDRSDFFPGSRFNRHLARRDGFAIDMDCTGTTLRDTTSEFSSR